MRKAFGWTGSCKVVTRSSTPGDDFLTAMITRSIFLLLGALLLVIGVGCEDTSGPIRRDLLGSWRSDNVPGLVIRMTLAETARSVDGAGFWMDADETSAFRITGALAREEVALFFDFGEGSNVTFQGAFVGENQLDGVLAGRGMREIPITFLRQNLP